MTQINPPFDGSEPCVGCDPVFRDAKALMFNAMNRFGQPSMIEKLWDLKKYHPTLPEPQIDHPIVPRFVEIHRKLVEAMQGVTLDGMTLRWVPGVMERLNNLGDEWREVLRDLDPLFEAHFDDNRHCSGGENVLRAEQGSKHTLWGAKENTGYNHTVTVVVDLEKDTPPDGWHFKHAVCGMHYELHEHFLERLRKDPTFYGKFYCGDCHQNVPWAQMEGRSDL